MGAKISKRYLSHLFFISTKLYYNMFVIAHVKYRLGFFFFFFFLDLPK